MQTLFRLPIDCEGGGGENIFFCWEFSRLFWDIDMVGNTSQQMSQLLGLKQ
jgi:hypothetical protein